MEILLPLVAFAFGFISKASGLPSLVGYLCAGFALKLFGFEAHSMIDTLAHMGVTILLFCIGLKLNIKKLIDPSTFLSSSIHIAANTLVFAAIFSLLSATMLLSFAGLNFTQSLLVAFAASFSSTVCAMKVMGEKGEMSTRHGQLTLSLLVLQDIFAVIFITIASKKVPSLWALSFIALPLLRKPLLFVLNKCGHQELLCLAGFILAFAGGHLFDIVGLKADLGSLIFGMLLASHKKSEELYNAMSNIKELMLICFFLSIGLVADITTDLLLTSFIFMLILPIKSFLYFFFFSKFNFRSRTSLLATLNLNNYSEFGLIVSAIGYKYEILSSDWLVVLALSISLSFIVSVLINNKSHYIYKKFRKQFNKFQSHKVLEEDINVVIKNKKVVIIGMQQLGQVVYDKCKQQYPDSICGIDTSLPVVQENIESGRIVFCADGENIDFWEQQKHDQFELIIISTPKTADIVEIYKQLKSIKYKGKTIAIAMHEDEKEFLKSVGIDHVFSYVEETGAGYAQDALAQLS